MAVSLPNGTTWHLATGYATALSVSAASTATETVLTVTNTLVAGDLVEYNCAWSAANGRIFRVKAPSGTSVTLEGLDTSDTAQFPTGGGVGTIRKISGWQQITQVLENQSSGGEPQYQTFSFMEDSFDRQIPSTTSAQNLSMSIADDPTLPGYIALRNAAQSRAAKALKAVLPQGGMLLYSAFVAFDETPSMTKGNVMACKAGFALQARPVRYAA